MSATGYTRKVTHLFEAGGEGWKVTHANASGIDFTETRCNGQEDCRMGGEAIALGDGKWALDEWTRKQIETYSSKRTADAVEAFFNEHGAPPAEGGES